MRSDPQKMANAFYEPPQATAVDGFVLIDHAAGLALTFSATAAAQTAELLLAAAAQARSQPPHAGDYDE